MSCSQGTTSTHNVATIFSAELFNTIIATMNENVNRLNKDWSKLNAAVGKASKAKTTTELEATGLECMISIERLEKGLDECRTALQLLGEQDSNVLGCMLRTLSFVAGMHEFEASMTVEVCLKKWQALFQKMQKDYCDRKPRDEVEDALVVMREVLLDVGYGSDAEDSLEE